MTGRADRTDLQREEGFTLIELVISVAILGIIVVALSGVVLGYLRNTDDTAARMSESQDVQFAAAYWQRDVASIGVRSSTYDESAGAHTFPLEQSIGLAACTLPAGATAVVTLGWSQYSSLTSTDAPTLVKVTWATKPDGSALALIRVRCGTEPSTVEVAHSLASAPTVICRNDAGTAIACTGSGSAVPTRVDLGVTSLDSTAYTPTSYQATLTGERRQT